MKATLKKVRNRLHCQCIKHNLCKMVTTGLPLDVIKTPFGYSYDGAYEDPVSESIMMMSIYSWGLEEGANRQRDITIWNELYDEMKGYDGRDPDPTHSPF